MQSVTVTSTRVAPAAGPRSCSRAQPGGRGSDRAHLTALPAARLATRPAPVTLRAAAAAGGQTADMDAERRARESQRVMERTTYVHSAEELDAFLSEAGDKLVFLNVESPDECDLSDYPDPLDVQRNVSDDAMAPCTRMKQTLARVARDCNDAVFLTLEVDADHSAEAKLAADLGVTRFPTFQYYKNSELVWEHTGAGMYTKQAIGEGMLFYGGQVAGGEHSEDFITEVKSAKDLEEFKAICALPQTTALGVDLDVPCEKQLAVVDFSAMKNCPASLHIYPAVLALAKNTAGACRWARCLIDNCSDSAALAQQLNVTDAPTFVFFEGNREVGRYVGSDRMALMNKVIEIQKAEGIRMPDRQARKRIPTAEAKRIAKEARAKQKANQWTM